MTEIINDKTTLIYRDHRIALNSEFTFSVSGPAMSPDLHRGGNQFKSISEAKERIDQLLKIKGVKDKRKLRLRVLVDADGLPEETITGIHSVSGNVLGTPQVNRSSYHRADLYPAGVQWISDLLEEKQRLDKRISAIRSALKDYEISASRDYRIGSNADRYENALRNLEKEHAEATDEARKLNDQPRVVYPKPD